jgi:steroid 5-alpha reductase family enzyme
MSPLLVVIIVAAAVSAACWIASLLTRDTSWVDRIWSVVPVVYVWVFAGAAGFADVRLLMMASLVTLWGARLTFNFARKGGYTGVEDYRWAVLRARMSPAAFQVFNLFFIVLFQNALLALIALPALTALENPTPYGPVDATLAVLFLAALIGETVADQQQWNFHRWKAAETAAEREPRPRFLQTGLWSTSRHPNFFFEQAQWWIFFLMGAAAAGTLLVWTVAGAALLTALFVGSTVFTESITRGKYAEYADYQARVSPVVPWWPRRLASGTRTA